jgi:hypothetical protein
VRAQEVQLERVVHHLTRVVHHLTRVVHHLTRAGHGLALDAYLAVPSGGIGAGGVEELTPGHGDQPAPGVPRLVVRPHADGLDQGVLHGILGRREVGSATDEDADHGGG